MTRREWARWLGRAACAALVLTGVTHAAPGATRSAAPTACPSEFGPEPRTAAERARRAEWTPYLKTLPKVVARLPARPDRTIVMPVAGVAVRRVANTFGTARSGGRAHEGQDIFAPVGTRVYSATDGVVWRVGRSPLGGRWVFTVGAGGRRYYYAHLDRYAPGLREGDRVTTRTLLGFVGRSGNAARTPPHLHFEVNVGSQANCDYRAIDPLPLMVDRRAP